MNIAFACTGHRGWIEHVEALMPLIPGLMLVYIGFRQWKTDDTKRRYSFINRYLKNYRRVSKAISLTIEKGQVGEEAGALFWQARDEARLILEDEIADFTESLFKLAHESYRDQLLLKNGGLEPDERVLKAKRNSDILAQMLEIKLYEKYRKYIKP